VSRRLDRIIDLTHALVKLTRDRLAVFGGAVRIGLFGWSRQPAVADATDRRLGALKHMYDLSDEALCNRWIENPISNSSVGKSSSNIGCHSIARR
jgi:IS5 family transposase